MDDRKNYLWKIAKRLSNGCGKPSAVVAAMAFFLLWTAAAAFINVPLVGHLIVNAAISMVILLMVIFLQNAHKQDIRQLQAKIEDLIAERQSLGRASPDTLTEAELQQVRDLLQRSGNNNSDRRANRDRRPSLF